MEQIKTIHSNVQKNFKSRGKRKYTRETNFKKEKGKKAKTRKQFPTP